jgi:hypothetical protein
MQFNERNEIVIDELKLCYLADRETMACLAKVEVGAWLELHHYKFYRLLNERFRFFFVLVEDGMEVAQLKFGHFTDEEDAPLYVYLKVLNHVLYDAERLQRLIALPDEFGMVFNNFTAVDLALDGGVNFPSLIKRMMRDKTVTTIINGKAVKDRKKALQGVSFEYSSTLDRLNHPTITVKQKKAIANKCDGISVQAYDKKAEIDHQSDKHYILDHYGNPKRLYRLEIRLHYRELKDYFAMFDKYPVPEDLFDAESLRMMFFYHLSAVIRFTRGRRKIDWETLLKCNGRG